MGKTPVSASRDLCVRVCRNSIGSSSRSGDTRSALRARSLSARSGRRCARPSLARRPPVRLLHSSEPACEAWDWQEPLTWVNLAQAKTSQDENPITGQSNDFGDVADDAPDQVAGWFDQGIPRGNAPARSGRGDRHGAGQGGRGRGGQRDGRRSRPTARKWVNRDRTDRAAHPHAQGPRCARRTAPLDRAHHGSRHHAALSGSPARFRSNDRERLLLRRRDRRPQPFRDRLSRHRGRDGAGSSRTRSRSSGSRCRWTRLASSSPTSARHSRWNISTASCTSSACSASIARASSSISAGVRTFPTPARSGHSSCSPSPAPTGRGRPTARCSSGSTARPSSTRKSSRPISHGSRKPRNAITARSARSWVCSRSRPWWARASSSGCPREPWFAASSRPS